MEKKNLNPAEYDHVIVVDIDCYDRTLTIAWNGQLDPGEVHSIADRAYFRWTNVGNYPEVEGFCCEEYVLHTLSNIGLEYDFCYGEEDE